MRNVAIEVEGSILKIEVDLSKEQGASKSGKSVTIASTDGNVALKGFREDVKIGLNVYRSRG